MVATVCGVRQPPSLWDFPMVGTTSVECCVSHPSGETNMAAQGRDYRRRVWLVRMSIVSVFPGVSKSWLRTISYRYVLFIHSVSQLALSKCWARHHVKHTAGERQRLPSPSLNF